MKTRDTIHRDLWARHRAVIGSSLFISVCGMLSMGIQLPLGDRIDLLAFGAILFGLSLAILSVLLAERHSPEAEEVWINTHKEGRK